MGKAVKGGFIGGLGRDRQGIPPAGFDFRSPMGIQYLGLPQIKSPRELSVGGDGGSMGIPPTGQHPLAPQMPAFQSPQQAGAPAFQSPQQAGAPAFMSPQQAIMMAQQLKKGV